MKTIYSSAEVEVHLDMTGEGALPVIDSPDKTTMSVELVCLRYHSEGGQPWITSWTCSGYSTSIGYEMIDISSARTPRRDTPGWLLDLIVEHRPRTGDRVLPEL